MAASEPSGLVDVAHELYGLRPDEFTQARNVRARAARDDGDRGLSDAVRSLPKPGAAAWVVNMVARHRTDELEQVLGLGAALRAAQESLDGDQLRQLNRERRQLTAAVTRNGRALAAQLGGLEVSKATATQVEETLHAAMTDEDAATAVRTGLLVRPLSAAGLGEVDLSGAVAVPSAMGERAPRISAPAAEGGPEPEAGTARRPQLHVVPDDTRARDEARAAVARAEEAARQAHQKLGQADRHTEQLEARSLQLQGELEEVRRRVAELEHELDTVDEELEEAQALREGLGQDDAAAAETVAKARVELDRLGLPGRRRRPGSS